MISPKIIYILIFIFTSGFSLNLFFQSSDSTLILDQLIQEMLLQNPELQVSYKQWQVTAAQAPQAGALPDPVLGIGVMNLPVNSFTFNQEMMTGKQISAMQMFPFPGKHGTRKAIGINEAAVAEQNYLQKQAERKKDFKKLRPVG